MFMYLQVRKYVHLRHNYFIHKYNFTVTKQSAWISNLGRFWVEKMRLKARSIPISLLGLNVKEIYVRMDFIRQT